MQKQLVLAQGTRTGLPLTYVYPWYLLCSTLGFLGIIAHKYPLYRAYIGISYHNGVRFARGTSLPIPWFYAVFFFPLRSTAIQLRMYSHTFPYVANIEVFPFPWDKEVAIYAIAQNQKTGGRDFWGWIFVVFFCGGILGEQEIFNRTPWN